MRKKPAAARTSASGSLDKTLLITIILLSIFGVAMVFNASVVDATRTFGDKFFYVKRQLIWIILGLAAMVATSRIDYKFWEKIAVPFLGATIVLLVAVLIPGIGVSALGASRRIDLGFIGLQPSELAKTALAVYLASSLARQVSVARFIAPLLAICFLVMIQPDMGTTSIIVLSSFAIYFTSGAPFLYLMGLALAGGVGGLILALTSDYRRERILTYLNPHADPASTSYHVRQILVALGSGGFFGLGLGQSRQKHLFLPEPATDSIFAIIGEELGFVGATALILAFMLLVWRGYTIAAHADTPFGKLLAVGITSIIAFQAFINLSAMVALIPLTGIPLPLVSYGGSSLVVSLASLGILLNISRYSSSTK